MKVLMSTSKQVVKMILFYSSHYLVRNEQEIAELSFFNYIFYCFPPTLRYLHNFFLKKVHAL